MNAPNSGRGSRLMVIAAATLVSLCCLGFGTLGMGVVAVAAWQQQAAKAPGDILYEENVQYGTGGGQPLVLDIARPKIGDGPFPAIVCIHGGGWKGGDKSAFRVFAQNLARQGYVAVTVRYRFAPAHTFPAQVEDVKAAVRYLRANAAEFKVDPDRIGAMGGSAGGHLALMLGATEPEDNLEGTGGHAAFSSAVQAVASIAGPSDLRLPFPESIQPLVTGFLGGTKKQKGSEHRQASPIIHLSADDPPILAIHGTADTIVPYEHATLLIEASEEAGVDARLITIEKGGHGFGGPAKDWLAANEEMVKFFDKHLKRAVP